MYLASSVLMSDMGRKIGIYDSNDVLIIFYRA